MKKSLGVLCFFSVASIAAVGEEVSVPKTEIKEVMSEVQPIVKETKEAPKKIKKERYVVIDAQKIITDTGLDKEPMQELMGMQQKFQKEIKEMADNVLKLEQEIKAKSSALSPEALSAKQTELNEENQKMQLKVNNANNQLRTADMQARTKIFQQLQQYVQETLVDKGVCKIVFERSGGIIAFAKGVDKTDDITRVVKTDLAKKTKTKEAPKVEAKPKVKEHKKAATIEKTAPASGPTVDQPVAKA
jgi:Skp family chaperone for outer membrane proteins